MTDENVVKKNAAETSEIAKDVGETPVVSSKHNKKIMLWPSWVIISCILILWTFFHEHSWILVLLFIGAVCFMVFCLFSSLWFLAKKKFRQSFAFILPFLLVLFIESFIRPTLIHARHYVEFLRHKNKIIAELNSTKNKPNYKEYSIEHSGVDKYMVIFDLKDEVIKKHGTVDRGCRYSVYNVGGHFYMLEARCGDALI